MSRSLNSKLDDGVKVDVVTADQMTEADRQAIFNREASVDAIPDLDVLTGHVLEILQYLEKPETAKLIKTNESAVKMYLNGKYADTVPLGIITVLLDEGARDENVERLLGMFEKLRLAKSGQLTLEDAEKSVTDEVNQRYIYSKYGSKEAFEKELAKEVAKEQKRKNVKNAEALRHVGRVSIKD
ncbi:hypothetical protein YASMINEVIRUS_372 [Yasminevirus sp. GU-2018]|uniref:Uncharacterized protein n=1 Tax=Yasminevirus sp. GU-2018 TaxID=2420051 RepID=A0A5K0U7G0_9VIRU|nr:hypothetical protein YASMINEVIRUS_372 [Yasminevirus sp. GU-2018]